MPKPRGDVVISSSLPGFVTLSLWDVYCVNGCGSFWLGYAGVGFGGNCDCRYGVLYAPMLGGVYVGYSGIFSFFFGASVPGGGCIYIRLFSKEIVKTDDGRYRPKHVVFCFVLL